MISHRGISVITPLPFGGGEGGGANWKLVCEVTPFGLLIEEDGLLGVQRKYRGISVITEGVSKCSHPLFYAQSPDFLKPGLCYFLKFLYL